MRKTTLLKGEKTCSRCHKFKPADSANFHSDPRGIAGLSARCIPCVAKASKERREKMLKENPEKYESNLAAKRLKARQERMTKPEIQRDRQLRCQYGIDLDDYDRLLKEQEGGCAICCSTVGVDGRRLHVDHDHACCERPACGNCVRGLLCDNCNRGLGAFKDDTYRLGRAIEYLRRTKR